MGVVKVAGNKWLSAYFLFSQDERQKVKADFPDYSKIEVAKETRQRWVTINPALKRQYGQQSLDSRRHNENAMTAYKPQKKKKDPNATKHLPSTSTKIVPNRRIRKQKIESAPVPKLDRGKQQKKKKKNLQMAKEGRRKYGQDMATYRQKSNPSASDPEETTFTSTKRAPNRLKRKQELKSTPLPKLDRVIDSFLTEQSATDKSHVQTETGPTTYKPQKKKKKKDPNAPKPSLSAYFIFRQEERMKLRAENPSYSICEVAEELGRRWTVMPTEVKQRYQQMAEEGRRKYGQDMATYHQGSNPPAPEVTTSLPSTSIKIAPNQLMRKQKLESAPIPKLIPVIDTFLTEHSETENSQAQTETDALTYLPLDELADELMNQSGFENKTMNVGLDLKTACGVYF